MKIVKYPAKVLMEPTKAIEHITPELLTLAGEMLYTLDRESAIGLAANQVGKDISLFVMDTRKAEPTGILEFFVNPVITNSEGSNSIEEGCLSFPRGKTVRVPRSAKVTVQYVGLDKKNKTIELEGISALVAAHEIDHLNGKVMTDYEVKL
jgi:peptide deformylase